MNRADISALKYSKESTQSIRHNSGHEAWAPSLDAVISRESEGSALSRFSDFRWNLSPFLNCSRSVNFGDGKGKGDKLCARNAYLLRLLMAWWLLGPYKIPATTAIYRFHLIKPLFALLSAQGIHADELSRRPDLLPDLAHAYKGNIMRLSGVLVDVLRHSESLGFKVLEADQINNLSSYHAEMTQQQTPYIPARIWQYQYARLRECVDDFLEVRTKVVDLYRFVVDAYLNNVNALGLAALGSLGDNSPFVNNRKPGSQRDGRVFYGNFEHVCREYGVYNIISKWIAPNSRMHVNTFGSYLTLINHVGLGCILNVSLMRSNEAAALRASCLETITFPSGEITHVIRGRTSKTIQEEDALWVVPSSVKPAIEAMTVIAEIRAETSARILASELDQPVADPFLYSRACEPWTAVARKNSSKNYPLDRRSYLEVLDAYPQLLDRNVIRIQESDLEMARRITPNLDTKVFTVGNEWPLAWHQLRRTGAVNMLASGLVSDTSLQYQLKHSGRSMTLYYGSNFSSVQSNFDHPARRLYEDESYAAVARNFNKLHSDQFISPSGDKRKNQILSPVTGKEHAELVGLAKLGKIVYRETLLGACVKADHPCPFGGVTDVSQCMGFNTLSPCPDVLLQRSKIDQLFELSRSIKQKLTSATEGSPLFLSLEKQLEAVNRAIGVLNNV